MTGTVKHWNSERGFGFIGELDGASDEFDLVPRGKDVFVHARELPGSGRRNLAKGQMVGFDVEIGERGAQAVNVRLM